MLIVITMEVKITNSWLFREYLSAINENLGILATIFIAISRGLVAIKARFLVRDITREQRRFGGFLDCDSKTHSVRKKRRSVVLS